MCASKAAMAAPAVDASRNPRIEQLGGRLDCENSRSLGAHQTLQEGKRASAFRALCKHATRLATPIAAAGPVAASERLPNGPSSGQPSSSIARRLRPLLNGFVEELEAEPRAATCRHSTSLLTRYFAETNVGR
jgi:hypothetical protein